MSTLAITGEETEIMIRSRGHFGLAVQLSSMLIKRREAKIIQGPPKSQSIGTHVCVCF